MPLGWLDASNDLERNGWVCGYCGREVGGSVGHKRNDFERDRVNLPRFRYHPRFYAASGRFSFACLSSNSAGLSQPSAEWMRILL